MSKNKDTEKTRQLTEAELAAVSGGIKDFSFGDEGGYKTAASEGWGTTKRLRPKDTETRIVAFPASGAGTPWNSSGPAQHRLALSPTVLHGCGAFHLIVPAGKPPARLLRRL